MSKLHYNVYTAHELHWSTCTYVLNIVSFLLYWFDYLLEINCWQNSVNSDGFVFELQTDQVMQGITHDMLKDMCWLGIIFQNHYLN